MGTERSMDQVFINKLTDILEANLENEQFGVKDFSQEIGLSQSQLRRKLNALTNKSASQFIREYRLEKAMVMLQNNVATASEISYRVGFASPTYFNTCFREFYGYPPGEVKFRETPVIKPTKIIQISGQNKPSSTSRNEKPVKQKSIIFALISILIIVATSYLIYSGTPDIVVTEAKEVIVIEKSIAVFPFINDSANAENVYLGNGIMTGIQDQLAKIGDLKVKSRTFVDQYIDQRINIKKVRAELEVNYIIEGSVQKEGDNIRITAQLIDVASGNHLWSQIYDGNYTDEIFKFISTISKKIAKSMNAVITAEERVNLDESITIDIQAYDKTINAAYERDIYWRTLDDKHLEKAHLLIDQALEIEPEYVKALLVKGGIYLAERKFDMAITYLNQVKKIDPNNRNIDVTLGEYYYIQGDHRNAIKYYTKAVELNKDEENLWSHAALGRSYGMIGEPIKGIKYINMALKSNNDDLLPLVYFHIAKIYLENSMKTLSLIPTNIP